MAPMAATLTASMASSLIQPVSSALINVITGKGQEGGFLPLLALPLTMKSEEQEEDIIIWTIWVKVFSFFPFFKLYRDY